MFMVLLVLPLGFALLMLAIYPGLLTGDISYPAIVLGASFYYLFIWLFFFFSFLDYYLDVWVITSRRIIDVEQRGFFSRVIGEHGLNKIQDVASEAHGAAATFLRYGDVYVQTAGTKQRFKFHQVPDPEGVRDLIIGLIYEYKKKHPEERVEAVANVTGMDKETLDKKSMKQLNE